MATNTVTNLIEAANQASETNFGGWKTFKQMISHQPEIIDDREVPNEESA